MMERPEAIFAARDPSEFVHSITDMTKKEFLFLPVKRKIWLDSVRKIRPFTGHYYKDRAFVCYHDISRTEEVCEDDVSTICQKIHDKLTKEYAKDLSRMQRSRVSVVRRTGFFPLSVL